MIAAEDACMVVIVEGPMRRCELMGGRWKLGGADCQFGGAPASCFLLQQCGFQLNTNTGRILPKPNRPEL